MLSHHSPLTLLALLGAPLAAPAAHGEEKPGFVEDRFVSGGKTIRVERFEPAAEGKHPTVVFLYGVDGIHAGNAGAYRGVARLQADRGFVVLIVHYLDRTETRPEEIPALQKGLRTFLLQEKGQEKQEQLPRYFAAWKEAVKDALGYARKQEKVDGERIGLLGISLGGFLTAAVAAEPEQRVAAVVTLFG